VDRADYVGTRHVEELVTPFQVGATEVISIKADTLQGGAGRPIEDDHALGDSRQEVGLR
jgi:hypothetical protein